MTVFASFILSGLLVIRSMFWTCAVDIRT